MSSSDTRPTLTRELLERYLSGDGESEYRLFESHRAELMSRVASAHWMGGLRKHVAAEDLVHEVVERLTEVSSDHASR